MSDDVVCGGCGSAQPAGAPFCALCGREFPRTGRAPVTASAAPRGGVQEAYRARATGPGEPVQLVHTGTTEQGVVSATQIPARWAASSPAAPPAQPYAHVGRRVVAYLLDAAVMGLLSGVVYGVGYAVMDWPTGYFTQADPEFAVIVGQLLTIAAWAGVATLAYGISMLVWEARTGKTLGNLALGIRTVGADGGAPLGFWRALLRWVVVWACSLVPLVGIVLVQLSPLWDANGRRQGWHDKAARAVVVDVRAAGPVPTPSLRPTAPAAPPAPASSAAPALAVAPVASAPAHPAAPSAASPARPTAPVQGFAAASWQGPPPASSDGPLVTGVPGRAPAEPSPAPSSPAPVAAGSADEAVEETRMQPAQRQELRSAPVAALVLELESGERVRVDGAARVGRNPQATAAEQVQLIRVDDPSRSVSKNHADLGVDSAGLWVADRGSTNGTVVSVAGQPPRVAESGARVRVPVGATIHVGDRRLTVRRDDR